MKSIVEWESEADCLFDQPTHLPTWMKHNSQTQSLYGPVNHDGTWPWCNTSAAAVKGVMSHLYQI
jgi:hypothetical protein